MKKYYIKFLPSAKVDYLLLLSLYNLAQYNEETKTFTTIKYKSVKELSNNLNVSPATITRMFSNTDYTYFLQIDKHSKTILLLNDFTQSAITSPFVVLTDKEVKLCQEIADNLFIKYLIYTKYYCGYNKNKQQDFTALQFLRAFGYSEKSHSQIAKLSNYNNILKSQGIVSIKKYRDELGHTRNIYKI